MAKVLYANLTILDPKTTAPLLKLSCNQERVAGFHRFNRAYIRIYLITPPTSVIESLGPAPGTPSGWLALSNKWINAKLLFTMAPPAGYAAAIGALLKAPRVITLYI